MRQARRRVRPPALQHGSHLVGAHGHGSVGNVSESCESCGSEEDVLHAVRRRYVVPQSWDNEGSDRTLDEIEHWCYACCTHYPHVPAEG